MRKSDLITGEKVPAQAPYYDFRHPSNSRAVDEMRTDHGYWRGIQPGFRAGDSTDRQRD